MQTRIIIKLLSIFAVAIGEIHFAVVFEKVQAQKKPVLVVRESQRSVVTQRIGTTDITITYHSPLAKGRKVFGNLVPYNFVVDGKEYPWRAGANQSTKIEFAHPVKVEGKPIAAGKYSLHALVTENEWTFIFSKNTKLWGSFKYKAEEDALRVKVKSKNNPYQEWLSYQFIKPQKNSAEVLLTWAKKHASFRIEVNVDANLLSDLKNIKEKTWEHDWDIAKILYKRNRKDPEVIKWLDNGLAKKKDFYLKIFKAEALMANGRKADGEQLKKEAMKESTGFNLYYYGLDLYKEGRKKKAYKIFSYDIKNHPKSWPAYLGMAEYHILEGNEKEAVKYLKKAWENASKVWKDYTRYRYYERKIVLDAN